MKKGDLIEQRKLLPKGKELWHGLKSEEEGKRMMGKIGDHYNFSGVPGMAVTYDQMNPGLFAIVLEEEAAVYTQARVNWRVGDEIGIRYTDTGGATVVNLVEEDGKDWVVIESSAPQYQSEVEHMSDEQLRASIEELRGRRVIPPAKVTRRKSSSAPKVPALTPEEKKTQAVLKQLSPEEMLELKRKMGLV